LDAELPPPIVACGSAIISLRLDLFLQVPASENLAINPVEIMLIFPSARFRSLETHR
jgi:hypothetical protein